MFFTVKEPVLNCLDQEPGTEARSSQCCLRGSPAISAGIYDGGDPTDTDCPQHLSGKNREPLWISTMGIESSSLLPFCLLFLLTLFLFLSLPPTPFSSLELFKPLLAFPFHFPPPLPHHYPQDRLPVVAMELVPATGRRGWTISSKVFLASLIPG